MKKLVVLELLSNHRVPMFRHIREFEVKTSITTTYEKCEKEMKENAKETDYILENWLVEHKKKRSCPFLKVLGRKIFLVLMLIPLSNQHAW
ncbi:hypothetical protein P3S67_011699 [Capsicum chacoense]